MRKRTYLSESHRKYSEACQREVEEMSKHPLSHEQMQEQMRHYNIQRAYLDWTFDQDKQNIYRFSVDRKTHGLEENDRVVLTVDGGNASQLGEILRVEDDGLLVHTDEWLDISEAYSIKKVTK